MSPDRAKKPLMLVAILLLVVNLSNTKWDLFKWSKYSAIRDYNHVRQTIALIPGDATVASLSALIPHIPKREGIYMLPKTSGADFILLHSGINTWPMAEEEFRAMRKALFEDTAYACIEEEGNVELFIRLEHEKVPPINGPGR